MTWSPGRTWAESERLVGRAAPGYGWRGSRRWVLRGGIRHARRALSQRLSRSRDDAGAPPALGERKRLDDALAVGAVVPLSLFLVSNLSGLRCLQRSESAPSAPLGVPFLGVSMRPSFRLILAAGLVLAAFSSPLLAGQDSDWSTDRLDDSWVEHSLARPQQDRGWCQPCRADWNDHRVAHCEVRTFSDPQGWAAGSRRHEQR